MTALYIDGVSVTLPDDFSVAITEENPFLTKNGSFTFDISLSLLDKVNAKLYRNKNRTNESTSDIESRTAVLISEDKVLMRGIEIILGFEDTDVKIQLVAGNSAFNYTFSQKKKIWEYDFGNENELTPELAEESLSGSYPEFRYICPPFLKRSYNYDELVKPKDIINLYTRTINGGVQPDIFRNGPYPCPYLIYYLEKFLQLKGLTIKQNDLLNSERAKSLYVLNNNKTKIYSRILPDWTESEFIQECENFFNITIDVELYTNEVYIKRLNNKLEEGINHIDMVLKSKEINISEQNNLNQRDYSNPEYELPGTPFFKYMNLNETVLENSIVMSVPNFEYLINYYNEAALILFYDRNESTEDEYNVKLIFRCQDTGQMFIPLRSAFDDLGGYTIFKLYPIDSFSRFKKDEVASISLRIIPAEMKCSAVFYNHPDQIKYTYGYNRYPCSNSSITKKEGFKLSNLIEDGHDDFHPEYLQVAFFAGFCLNERTDDEGDNYFLKIPFSYVDKNDYLGVTANRQQYFVDWSIFSSQNFKHTLRLTDSYGLHAEWFDDYFIDKTKKFIFYFKEQNFNIGLPFIINNKEFICEKIEYDIDKNGIQGSMMKGTFYPLQTI